MKIEKILLVNDTRGAQEYLMRAFLDMGIHCDFAYFGWSTINRIENQLNFDPYRNMGFFGKLLRPIANVINLSHLGDYDVASFVHRISFIDRPNRLRYLDLPILRKKVSVMSYTALGCDELGFIAGNGKLPYSPCDTCQAEDDIRHYCPKVVRPSFNRAVKALNSYFDCAFSMGVEYSHLGEHFKNHLQPMPLPVDLSEIPWRPSISKRNQKVKIIHTPSRAGFKGTDIVLKSIALLTEIRKDFTFDIISGLSFKDYIAAVAEADIVIDQVWSQSPGMNALWLLGMGKIVLSGNTVMAGEYMQEYKSSPIINADPDPAVLCQTLNELISDKMNFSAYSESGLKYLETNHDHRKVAKRYLDAWSNI